MTRRNDPFATNCCHAARPINRITPPRNSTSRPRVSVDRQPAVIVARQEAGRVAAEATTSQVMETVAVDDAVLGASQWLATQAGKRELIVLSDFQLGTIDTTALDSIPRDVGL